MWEEWWNDNAGFKKVKARIDGECIPAKEIERLKLDRSISTIRFDAPYKHNPLGNSKKVIDSYVSVLKANRKIKTLTTGFWCCHHCAASKLYLLETLARGEAGESLENLWLNSDEAVSVAEVDMMDRYLRRNRNILRLGIDVGEGPASLQLMASLKCSSVRDLRLDIWHRGPWLGELSAALAECSSIRFLAIGMHDIGQDITELEFSLLLRGIAKLPCLTSLQFECNQPGSGGHWLENSFMNVIKASDSIQSARLRTPTMTQSIQEKMDSFCVLNRVFCTSLVGFGPSDLWSRVLSKTSDGSARATLLYRLLREKPDFIIGQGNRQIDSSVSNLRHRGRV